MKKLLYLAVILGAGYFLFQKFETEIFNAVPQEIRRKVFSVDIPVEYRGKFVSDLKANTDWIRQQNYKPKVQSILISVTGKQTIEIGARESITTYQGKAVPSTDEVVEKGPGYIVVGGYDEGKDKFVRTRLEKDGDGFWIFPEELRERIPGFKERYRRVE